METIIFNFKASVDPQTQRTALTKIRAWEGVNTVTRFDPNAKDPYYARVYVLYVEKGADADAIVEQLLSLPEIENAQAPAQRGMV
jgi:hypothetical protein